MAKRQAYPRWKKSGVQELSTKELPDNEMYIFSHNRQKRYEENQICVGEMRGDEVEYLFAQMGRPRQ